jgi:hypothetical protein
MNALGGQPDKLTMLINEAADGLASRVAPADLQALTRRPQRTKPPSARRPIKYGLLAAVAGILTLTFASVLTSNRPSTHVATEPSAVDTLTDELASEMFKPGITNLRTIPLQRQEGVTLLWGAGRVLALGGERSKEVALYDPTVDRWDLLPSRPGAEGPLGGVWTGKDFVVVVPASHATYSYDPRLEKWTELPALPSSSSPMSQFTLSVGGTGDWIVVPEAGVYLDASRKQWRTLPALPGDEPWRERTVALGDHQIWALREGRPSFRLDTGSGGWSTHPALPEKGTGGGYTAAAVIGDRVVFANEGANVQILDQGKWQQTEVNVSGGCQPYLSALEASPLVDACDRLSWLNGSGSWLSTTTPFHCCYRTDVAVGRVLFMAQNDGGSGFVVWRPE